MHQCRGWLYWTGVKKRDIKFLRQHDIFDCGVKNKCVFVLLKEELPNKSTSENLESFRFEKLLSMFRMSFMIQSFINVVSGSIIHQKKRGQGMRQWGVFSISLQQLQIEFMKS